MSTACHSSSPKLKALLYGATHPYITHFPLIYNACWYTRLVVIPEFGCGKRSPLATLVCKDNRHTAVSYFLTSLSRVRNLLSVPSNHCTFLKFRNNRARNHANSRQRPLSENGQVVSVGVFVSTMGDNYLITELFTGYFI